jgi:hypothetical protein
MMQMQAAKPGSLDERGSLIGLAALSCSTLLLEIVLTKFLGFKLYHHMTFAVLSFVILSFGAAGTATFLFPKFFGTEQNGTSPWNQAGNSAILYSISVCLVIPILCACPIAPSQMGVLARVAMPLLFLLLSLPFFFAGICISQTLTASKYPVQVVYFWDLLAAAVGAALCPFLLPIVGGFGIIDIVAILGVIGAFGYWHCANQTGGKLRKNLKIAGFVSIVLCAVYSPIVFWQFGLDILTFKEIGIWTELKDFGGIDYTHWNAIARVDVSKTGTSKSSLFFYGLSPEAQKETIYGRYITQDASANTRQFRIDGKLSDKKYLGSALWASPYVARPECQNGVVIGGGGGIDILIAKFFKIPHLKVIELNPAIYNILTGKADDPDRTYVKSLVSDENTVVDVLNDEARHFSTTQPPATYDTIQASGVDTLTAIQTGGMSVVENYLYTVDAVAGYMRMLKPGGILSLTGWRTNEPTTSVRMFINYLTYLDSIGVKEPWKHIVVLGSKSEAFWCDSMLKLTPFTPEELARIRSWAQKSGISVVFDPERKVANDMPFACEWVYYKLGFADAKTRAELIAKDTSLPTPVFDDKPYFYSFNRTGTLFNESTVPVSLMLVTVVIGLILGVLPMFKIGLQSIKLPVLWSAAYFSISGFAFLLFETAIIQLFSVFVGGPMYSLSVVLVAVLMGYAFGAGIASRVVASQKFFVCASFVLGTLFAALYWLIPQITHDLLPLPLVGRLIVAGAIALLCSMAIGVTVSLAMSVVRDRFGGVVSWMWGISSIANAIGSICFIAITQAMGIKSCLLLVATAYFFANLMFSVNVRVTGKEDGEPTKLPS